MAELEKIMEEIPPDFIPQFEEAAKEMISAFKDGAAGEKEEGSDDQGEDACGSKGRCLFLCLCFCMYGVCATSNTNV